MTEKQITPERWGFPNGVTNVAAPMRDGYWTPWHIAQAEIARLTAELEKCREGADATMAILTAIHALLYPPVVHTRQGIQLRFDPENPGEWAQRISDAIRDIPAAAIDAARRSP